MIKFVEGKVYVEGNVCDILTDMATMICDIYGNLLKACEEAGDNRSSEMYKDFMSNRLASVLDDVEKRVKAERVLRKVKGEEK